MTEVAKGGITLRIHYAERLKDDTIFDKSEGDTPLEFTKKQGVVIPGLD